MEVSRLKVHGCGVTDLPNGLPHLGLPSFCPRGSHKGRAVRDNQMVTKGKGRSLPWTLPISSNISGPNFEYHNWEHYPPLQYSVL